MIRPHFIYLSLLLSGALALTSCESTADVKLGESIPTLVVDAFINDLDQQQRIVLNYSQPFFDNTLYEPAMGAMVELTNDMTDQVIVFMESEPGIYTWSPSEGVRLDEIGATYTLTILFDEKTYLGTSELNRTTAVDSILFYLEEGDFEGDDDYIEARFFGRDPLGVGDAYWIKTFKNDTFLNRPSELNTAYDAGFIPGAELDGIAFIPPIRSSINPNPYDDDLDEDYVLGDRVRVEIHSITNTTRDFLNLMGEQTDRPGGFGELFATPLANVPPNITVTGGGNDERVLGQFCVSAVRAHEVTFTEDLLREDE